MWRDKELGAAFIVAPFFWGFLFLIYQPDLLWPLNYRYFSNTLLYPILEELVFRGLLQGDLYELTKGKALFLKISQANVLTSILFCLIHFIYHPEIWAVLIFIPSILFGYFRDKYQSTQPSILLHIYYNSGYFVLFG